jgi:hypothetical protein
MTGRCVVMIVSAVAFAALAAAPGPAEAADHSWTGGASAGQGAWSNTANWSGASAPGNGETIGTVSFPAITSPACGTSPPTMACGSSVNDLSGLQVGTLAIDDSLASTQGDVYSISGNGITLTGGLFASPASASTGHFLNSITVPITLGASQTWTVAGNPVVPGQAGVGAGITMAAPVTGQAHALTIDMNSGVLLGLSGDNEVGPLAIVGTASPGTGGGGEVEIDRPSSGTQSALNATDGNPVTLTNAGLLIADAAIGPLTVNGAAVTVGGPRVPPGTLTARAVNLDAGSTLGFTLSGNGATAGADYSQLRSTGDVSLGGAHLDVNLLGAVGGRCPAPRLGTVYTLVSTTGKLTGAFKLPNGNNPISYSCSPLPSYALQVGYHERGSPETVTATVVPAPPPGVRPGFAGAAPVSGIVLVRRRGRRTFTRLRNGTLIPAGSEVETTRGRVRIFAATNARGGVDSAELFGGRFIVRQKGRARPRTTFALSQPLSGCRPTAAKNATTVRHHHHRHRKRRIWVTEQNGRFNTRAQYVGTSVQGTTWLTADTCGASRVRVRHGTVVVHDFVHHRTIKLHGGQSVTVRRRG